MKTAGDVKSTTETQKPLKHTGFLCNFIIPLGCVNHLSRVSFCILSQSPAMIRLCPLSFHQLHILYTNTHDVVFTKNVQPNVTKSPQGKHSHTAQLH